MSDSRSTRSGRPSARRSFLALLASLAVASATATPVRAWDASTPPRFFPSPYGAEFLHDVAVQPGGGVIVAGTLVHPNVGEYEWDCSFVVARVVRGTGAVDWRTELPDCGDDETYEFNPAISSGREIARIDGAGHVVVGRFREAGAALEVVKLDGVTGDVLWQQIVAQPGERISTTHALALDAAGDVLVAGGDGAEYPVALDLFVAKLDGASGAERWRRELRGTSTDEDYTRNQAGALAVDAHGDVVVHGRLVDGGEQLYDSVPILLKLAGADGRELWRAAAPLPASADVMLDATGDAFVAGAGEVVKVAGADGTTLWRASTGRDVAGFFRQPATHVAIDGSDVAVASDVDDPGEQQVRVTVLEGASGAIRWQRDVGGPDVSALNLGDRTGAVAFDGAGHVVLAASVVDPAGFLRPLVAAFDRTSGEPGWEHALDGSPRAQAGAFGLVIDGDTAIAVGGVARDGAFTDGFVVALATASGAEIWLDDESARLPTDTRGVWLDEVAFDAAVDRRGDVVAVGRTWSGVEGLRFAVHKLDGKTGAVAWTSAEERNVYAFPSGLYDFPVPDRVAIAPGGDVLALAGEHPTTLVRLDGDRGTDLWSTDLSPSPPTYDRLARPLAVDAAGDVFVGGSDFRTIDGKTDRAMVVVKLDGTTGRSAWSAGFASRAAQSIALDTRGDVVAVGQGSDARREALLVKYDGATGSELWRHRSDLRLPGTLTTVGGAVLVSAARDVGNDFVAGVVLALDGATGAERWQSTELWGATVALASDAAGHVHAAGNSSVYVGEGQPLRYTAAAAKLDGATGATLWRRSLAELGTNLEVQAAAVDPTGTLVVAAREVPGRSWLFGLASADGRVLWSIGLGGDDTALDVHALQVAAPGRVVVSGARSEPGTGTGFAVLGIDVPGLLGPGAGTGRRCVARLASSSPSGRPAAERCTIVAESGRLAAYAR